MEKNTGGNKKFVCINGKNYPVDLWIKNMENKPILEILPPKKGEESETEVQAKLYCELLKLEQGFNVNCEVKITDHEHQTKDLVVFDKNKNPKCIIETKNWKSDCDIEKELNKKRRKAKLEENLKFNLPLFYCTHSDKIPATINSIKNLLEC